MGYDDDRAVYIYDRDGDDYPDITEELAGTDMFDPDSNPGMGQVGLSPDTQEAGGFPATSCRSGPPARS